MYFAHRYTYLCISVRCRKNKNYFPKHSRKVRLCNEEAQSDGSEFLSINEINLFLQIFLSLCGVLATISISSRKESDNIRISVLSLCFKVRHPICFNNYRKIFLFQVSRTSKQLVIQGKISCRFRPIARKLKRKLLELQV